ncbi:hypothetical protein EHEL_060300 [Encephalitozoon hellem ATCC 50504]|uniref:WD40 domain-containing protein n=1 Tax=Encephalitozoon hellem TaxID=27973 RepID=A0A9Q9F9H9_ENCHE|nr:uncharacterized protein EHEL_060300 [Encephalitozoon hellem ATCC 50504]AFM98404.1 hypothetical protein EHEL_060300 [Encephalitozoon hellem ATCC 50504]UTX43326.1 WD40 domain-containing protein [Encephalitozoon hellem]WEL38788.1 WD40 domain-containing protein [Encephalitozoon hellem]|eukprot:XP_003887385.1 hypothetical protein EHEL_060300 [Encephalitozoon hellem ATCC 50504]
MKTNESDLFKRYRVANQMASSFPLMVREANNSVFVTSTTRTSYMIYDVKKMNLLFCGPTFGRIHCTYQRGDVVYVGSYRDVYVTTRGGVVRCFTLPSGSVQSNKRVRVSEESMEAIIRQILGFGEIVLILTQNELFVTEDLNEMYKIEHDEIERLFHPHTYINKVVKVLKGGKMVLYNVSSRKEVYAYKPFEAAITAIEQSPVVDVVGIGLENGTIHIFNLRTDRVLFSFKLQNAVKELSFGGSRLMAITREGMFIFDLNSKKKMIAMENMPDGGGKEEDCPMGGILSGKFLDDGSLVASTKDSLSIYEVKDYNLEVIKRRRTYNNEIIGIEFMDERNVLVFGPRCVFNMNVYRDEQNFMFKFKGDIEMMDVNKSIVCFGKRSLHALNFLEKNSKFILNKDINCLAVYKDFCCFGKDKIILMNLKSKLVHGKFSVGEELVDLAMDFTKIVAATSSGIRVYTTKGSEIGRYEVEGIVSIRLIENFTVICTSTQILFYDDGVSRVFKSSDKIVDYCVSSDSKWIAILSNQNVFIYDILTTTLLDMLVLDSEAKFIRFSPNLDFLLAVSRDNDLILFSNKSNFQSSAEPKEAVLNLSEFRKRSSAEEAGWRHKRGNLYSELLLLKGLQNNFEERDSNNSDGSEMLEKLLDEDWVRSMSKEDVQKVICLVTPHVLTSMDIVQRILFNVLRYKSHMLEPNDIHVLNEKFAKEWNDFEENAMKVIGYLGIESDGLLQ